MRGAKVTEKLALATPGFAVAALAALAVLACGSLSCASNHRVSPWGGGELPPLSAFAPRPDLDAQLEAMDREAAAHGLRLEVELRGALPRGAGEVVVRGYEGVDAVGRRVTAVRVATARGVVMAVGPLAAGDQDRRRATELVPALVAGGEPGGGAFASGTDLNGDGAPDVAVRNEAGVLEIWAVRPAGAAPYAVELEAPPTEALDVDGDGWVDLAGRAAVPEGDPIAPVLRDVATFEGDRYTDRSAAARAFHAAAKSPPAAPPDDATRLRRAIERAWHARLAGEPRAAVLAALDREAVPLALRVAFAAHRQRVAAAGAATAPRTASGTPGGR